MNLTAVLVGAIFYIGFLFFVAWWVDQRARKRNRSLVQNPFIYSLSLAVYCTAWTYFGSVGRAASGGLSFLAIYLGPSLTAPLWIFVLRKMILISKHQRITSVADFISARFGKSGTLATLVTLLAVLGIIPYISIQLKAVTTGVDVLTSHQYPYFKSEAHFWMDAAFWVTAAMALFTILFAARKIDPNERHEGMVAAVAVESIIKLIAFWLVGLFVLYSMNNGPADLFEKAMQREDTRRLLSLSSSGVPIMTWNVLLLLSAVSFLLLPRQFHIGVVENTHPRHVETAMWLLPLYLLLINLFVLPIALAGKLEFDSSVLPDSYVLALPQLAGANFLALIVFIGGFSAATSMVIVSTTALSIMISNHLVVPVLIRMGRIGRSAGLEGFRTLIRIRRWSIVAVMVMAYIYLKTAGIGYDLVSVGLISFTAVAQFAPAALGGMYWKGATRAGAIAGLVVGFLIWAYCLPFSSLAQAGYFPDGLLINGPFGVEWLRPSALFGLKGLDPISHAAWWSLFWNLFLFVGVSLYTRPSALSLAQADLFVNIHRYDKGQEQDVRRRAAPLSELFAVTHRFLGEKRVQQLVQQYELIHQVSLKNAQTAEPELINFLETHLAGAIGAASARLMIDSVSKEAIITLEEVMQVLEQTQEVMRYSKALETKSQELEATTLQLTQVNEQLKALDRLKADFITTVTHELRTPVTSIKALSKILLDYSTELPKDKIDTYLGILVTESERISRLINQVLDIEKIQVEAQQAPIMDSIHLEALVQTVLTGMEQLFLEKKIQLTYEQQGVQWQVRGNPDRLTQVVINLLSNAYKFCSPVQGRISVMLLEATSYIELRVIDNGKGIPPEAQELIFGQFTQLNQGTQDKPQGTGLGLYITRQIVQQHGGRIFVESVVGQGACFVLQIPKF